MTKVVVEIEDVIAEFSKYDAKIQRLRKALAFYADEEKWKSTISLGHPQIDGMTSPIKQDGGERARAALEEKE